MYFMTRCCKICDKDTIQGFNCDEHIIEVCPNDCDLVENSAEYSSICVACGEENEYATQQTETS